MAQGTSQQISSLIRMIKTVPLNIATSNLLKTVALTRLAKSTSGHLVMLRFITNSVH